MPDDLSQALLAVRRLVAVDAQQGSGAALPLAREELDRFPELKTGVPSLTGTTTSTTRPRDRKSRDGRPRDGRPRDGRPRDRRSKDRLSALAELAEVIGWILFDAGHYRRAHTMNARALALADRSGDRWTARLTLLNESMLLTHTGHSAASLTAAARVQGPRPLPARVSTLTLLREAHAKAQLGAYHDPLKLAEQAHSRFLDGVSRHDPPWAWWIDEPELLGHLGWIHARLHRWDQAIPLLHEASTAPGPSYRHLFAAKLLATLTRARAWHDAEQVITQLAPRAAGFTSRRTTESLCATAHHLRDGARAPSPVREAAAHLLTELGYRPGSSRPSTSPP
ncbi:DNA-binding protein [Streptomyces sp. NPDC059009]|uniref:DNA-binding protein n=1 Tax=Streptomyces sp. NPDC059009 TaxID=3346694 RepID=UPI0036CE8BAF